jgi:hypothetical protein
LLMQKLGRKRLTLLLQDRLDSIPRALAAWRLELSPDGGELTYTYDTQAQHPGITPLLSAVSAAGVRFRDLLLGGSFYSIHMLPPFWQTVTLFNPVVYLVSGFRWSFYGTADVSIAVSLIMTLIFLAICLGIIRWIFKTGYRLKN